MKINLCETNSFKVRFDETQTKGDNIKDIYLLLLLPDFFVLEINFLATVCHVKPTVCIVLPICCEILILTLFKLEIHTD